MDVQPVYCRTKIEKRQRLPQLSLLFKIAQNYGPRCGFQTRGKREFVAAHVVKFRAKYEMPTFVPCRPSDRKQNRSNFSAIKCVGCTEKHTQSQKINECNFQTFIVRRYSKYARMPSRFVWSQQTIA